MAVRVVTDSASDLPKDVAKKLNIEVVPLRVMFGNNEEYLDGVDLSTDEFYRRLMSEPKLPTTSQPSVGQFVEAYERLAKDADGIVSVHVSAKVSGTYNAAIQAKEQARVECPIEVVDTFQASMGIGLVALEAGRQAQQGGTMEDVVKSAEGARGRCECFALFDTIEYLAKGGRIGKASALIGGLLHIRPMIIIKDGEVNQLGKVRTRKRGIDRLREVAKEFAPLEELSVMYSTTPDDAETIAAELGGLLPSSKEPFVARFGSVIGTYVGPNALGIGLMKARASG